MDREGRQGPAVRYDGSDADELRRTLVLPRVELFDSVGSTLDVAHEHAANGAEVIAKLDPKQLVDKLVGLGVQRQNVPVRILAIDDDPRTTELLAASLERCFAGGFSSGARPDGPARCSRAWRWP